MKITNVLYASPAKRSRDHILSPHIRVSGAQDTLAEAVELDHPCDLLQDNTCDIAAALQDGYVLTAVSRLLGATEAPSVRDALDALRFNGIKPTNEDFSADEEQWLRSSMVAESVECTGCGVMLYDVADRRGNVYTYCDNCGSRIRYMAEDDAYEAYDDDLDETNEDAIVGALAFRPSEVLKSCDPTAYREAFTEWLNSTGIVVTY